MTQLALGMDLPTDAERAQRAALDALPTDEDDLIAAIWDELVRYDQAVLNGDGETGVAILEQVRNLAVRMNDGTIFAIATKEGAYGRIIDAIQSSGGEVPMFGQPGRFIVNVLECRVLIDYRGLFGLGFSAHAVDFDRPFISPTGYRSYANFFGSFAEKTGLVDQVVKTIQLDRKDGTVPLGYKRHSGEEAELIMPEAPKDDPDWQPGGWIHKISQTPPPFDLKPT